jgi:tetratricopeptide (TPR) repeat protein
VRSGDNFLKAKLFQAFILFQENKMEDSLKLVEAILKQNSSDAKAHYIKGDILDKRKDFWGAIVEYNAVINQEPQNVLVLLKLANAFSMVNYLKLSETTYKNILEINSKVKQAHYGLVEIYKQKGLLEDAKEQLEKVLERYPDEKKALYSLGDIALKIKDLITAKRCYQRLLELEPGLSIVHYKNGLLSLSENRIEEATIYFEKSLTIDPDFVPALNQLANILKLDEAIERCKQQINRSPGNPDYHILLGKLYAAKHDFQAAQTSFRMALDLDPTSHEARVNLLRLAQSFNSVDKNIKKYLNLMEQNPDNLSIAMLLAAFFEQKGDHAKAIDVYEHVLNKNANMEVAANNLAYNYAEYEPSKENLAKAKELITPLLEKYRTDPHILDTGAWIFYRQGDFEGARDLLVDVTGKIESIPSIGYHLGMSYLRLGDKLGARKFLALSLSGKQEFSGKKEAEKVLFGLSYTE